MTDQPPRKDLIPANRAGVLEILAGTHGAMTRVTEALEAHKLHLLGEVEATNAHAKALMDLAQAERQSKLEMVQAAVAMIDRMLADLRGA